MLARRYADGQPLRVLAREIGRTEDAVKVMMLRLRKRLQECVESRMKEVR
jgi:DNA-directed RNA polymerase specialized sigma24 family protein